METRLKSLIFGKDTVIKKYDEDFLSEKMEEHTLLFDNEYVKGEVREIQLNGVFLSIRDIKVFRDYKVEVHHDFPLFKLHFEIEGSNHYTPFNVEDRSIYIPNGHYNLFILPRVNGVINYKRNYRKTLEIVFTENYLKKIIGNDLEVNLHDFGTAIANKKPFIMWETSKPISMELLTFIQEIVTCPYEGDLKKGFLEAKVNELLIVLLAKTREEKYKEENIVLPKTDYSKILEVEGHIQENLKKSLKIKELAGLVGINTSKLKHDFKIVFSSTIFKHITKLRMGKAKSLIEDNNFTISQASYEVGYKNPQHFTVAFKKVYGFMPRMLKKKLSNHCFFLSTS